MMYAVSMVSNPGPLEARVYVREIISGNMEVSKSIASSGTPDSAEKIE
jgi:hypothetical protein